MTSKSAKALRLVRVTTQVQKDLSAEIIVKYHSYVKSTTTGGRRIDYLIYLGDLAVGVIGVASMPFPISKLVLHYFWIMTGQRKLKPIFNNIGNNWKFTLTPEAPKNAGSRVLGIFVKLAMKDWKETYPKDRPVGQPGDDLKWVLTFVGAGHKGTIYTASGWKYVGHTSSDKMSYTGTPGAKVDLNVADRMKHVKVEKGKGERKRVYIKDLRPTEPVRKGEAGVVQSSMPGILLGDGVHSDPPAPLTDMLIRENV